MDQLLNSYLEKMEKALKPISVLERVDIIKELESEMHELESAGLTAEKIIERLGNPRKLARAYLGDAIVRSSSFSWKKLGTVICFYSYAGMGGMFLLPITVTVALSFMLAGAICPVAGVTKLIASLMGIDIPQIGVEFGGYALSAWPVFVVTLLVGGLCFLVGWWSWKLTIWFIRSLSKQKAWMKHARQTA